MIPHLKYYLERHEKNLVELVVSKLQENDTPVLDQELIRKELSGQLSTGEIVALLDELVEADIISAQKVPICPNNDCEKHLLEEDTRNNECNDCGLTFVDLGELDSVTYYFKVGHLPSRDIRWMIVIHGFNTPGRWQEKFSWLIANKLSYGAPILIYKYDKERLGVFFRMRHKILVRRLGKDIRAAFEFSKSNGRDKAPDVVIHSFGSLLFAKLLESSEFSDLKFGRIICVGSVINPNFDWDKIIESKRVQAVLCHCGGRDPWVPIAQFIIPDSGPAGRIGFRSKRVTNTCDDLFGHSTALEPTNLDKQLADGGMWDKFLTSSDGAIEDDRGFEHSGWCSFPSLVQFLTRYIILMGIIYISWKLLTCAHSWFIHLLNG